MGKIVLSEQEREKLLKFLEDNRPPELVNTYMYFLEERYHIAPVLFPKNKTIYMSADEAVKRLEKEGQIYHETKIKIGTDSRTVNEKTKEGFWTVITLWFYDFIKFQINPLYNVSLLNLMQRGCL